MKILAVTPENPNGILEDIPLDDPMFDTEANEKREAEWKAQAYARNRAIEYPAIADQLDEIYHNGINAWKAVIKVTKDKYPKG